MEAQINTDIESRNKYSVLLQEEVDWLKMRTGLETMNTGTLPTKYAYVTYDVPVHGLCGIQADIEADGQLRWTRIIEEEDDDVWIGKPSDNYPGQHVALANQNGSFDIHMANLVKMVLRNGSTYAVPPVEPMPAFRRSGPAIKWT